MLTAFDEHEIPWAWPNGQYHWRPGSKRAGSYIAVAVKYKPDDDRLIEYLFAMPETCILDVCEGALTLEEVGALLGSHCKQRMFQIEGPRRHRKRNMQTTIGWRSKMSAIEKLRHFQQYNVKGLGKALDDLENSLIQDRNPWDGFTSRTDDDAVESYCID